MKSAPQTGEFCGRRGAWCPGRSLFAIVAVADGLYAVIENEGVMTANEFFVAVENFGKLGFAAGDELFVAEKARIDVFWLAVEVN